MSTVLDQQRLPRADRTRWLAWASLALGLVALYAPTYLGLSRGLWREEAYAHGPIILAVFAFLCWQRRAVFLDESLRPAPVSGVLLLAFGLLLYLLGRTQSLPLFEVASHLPVIAGIVVLMSGFAGLRLFAFPILFLLFLVPLPGFVLEAATGPLKELVSAAVASMLSMLGYAVERNGVVLAVNGHELLVADACSGLNSLYSLLALGLLYTHLSGRRGVARVVLVMVGILPIAIAANMVRVLGLSLVAVHFGDEAARGILHDVAGFLVFSIAFLMLVGWDKVVAKLVSDTPFRAGTAVPARKGVSDTSFAEVPGEKRVRPCFSGFAAALAIIAIAMAAPFLKPTTAAAPIDIAAVIPTSFGEWRVDPDDIPMPAAPDVQANLDRLYSQVVARTYVNAQGERMMLTVAYGGDQSDALKAHRQEVCYRAQGFEVHGLARDRLATPGRSIPVTRMLAIRGDRSEPVTYWFTMGDRVVLGRLERLKEQLRNGLAGRIPDGMLVRVSSLSADPRAAFARQDAFMAAIVAAVPAADAARLVGAGAG